MHASFVSHICFQNELAQFHKEITHKNFPAILISLFHVDRSETQTRLEFSIGQFWYEVSCKGCLIKTFLSIFSHINKIAKCYFCATTKFLCYDQVIESYSYAIVPLFPTCTEISISGQHGKTFVELNSFMSSENCVVSD